MNSLDVLLWIQAHRTDVLNAVFVFFSAIGDTVAYLTILPILYWTLERRFLFRVLLLMVISGCLNSELKLLFHLPRPHDVFPEVFSVGHRSQSGNGFPSGHAQTAACLWLYIALQYRRRWVSVLSATTIALVGFSRIYLGAHWPADVLCGIAIGILTTGVFVWAEKWIGESPHKASRFLGCVFVTSALFIAGSVSLGVSVGFAAAGTLMGLFCGWYLGGERLRDVASLSLVGKVLCCLVGTTGAFAMYYVSRRHLHSTGVQLLDGLVMGLWITWAVPVVVGALAVSRRPLGADGSRARIGEQSSPGEQTSPHALSPPMEGRGVG